MSAVTGDDQVTVDVELNHPEAFDAVLGDLVAGRVASRLAVRDPGLWGPDAEEEAAKRLAWVDLASASRPLVPEVTALRDELRSRGLDRVVLCGMGGSSLAPEVICAWAGVDLVVLDSSDPDVVRRAVETELARTVVVVSSKSGGTVETDSQKRAFEKAFADAGIAPAERIVVVTDPGSPLDEAATAAGYRVFRADPDVGGRFSALSAFGLVPSGLAATRGVDKLVLADAGSAYPGLGDWIEQLVAESTGKHGVGILPVVVESLDAPNADPATEDSLLVAYGPGPAPAAASGWSARLDGPLGAQLLLWEFATAVAGGVLGINPFDQPDVESAKAAARTMLEGGGESVTPLFEDGAVTVFASPGWLPEGTSTVRDAVAALLDRMDAEHGYLAVQAYLDRSRDSALEDVRPALARRTGRPVTFGWGPRFLHSTGQYHKGGPATGLFLQVTSQPEADLAVPDRPFTFHEFLLAQAVGDGQVLAEKGRPVLRLHLGAPADLAAVADLLAGR